MSSLQLKCVDNFLQTTLSTTWYVHELDGPASGTGHFQRIGNSVRVRNLFIRYNLNFPAPTVSSLGLRCRVVYFIDHQPEFYRNPYYDEVLCSYDVNGNPIVNEFSHPNPNFGSRFEIIYDELHTGSIYSQGSFMVEKSIDLDLLQTFAASSRVQSGGLYSLFYINNGTSSASTIFTSERTTFTD